MKMGSIDYVIVGPGAEKNQGELIRHELMHLLAPSFHLPQKVVTPRLSATTFSYIGYKVQNRECVIRALNLIYQKEVLKTNIKSLIAREKKSFPYIEKANTLLEGKLKKRSYF
jgi:hypothetical protein